MANKKEVEIKCPAKGCKHRLGVVDEDHKDYFIVRHGTAPYRCIVEKVVKEHQSV